MEEHLALGEALPNPSIRFVLHPSTASALWGRDPMGRDDDDVWHDDDGAIVERYATDRRQGGFQAATQPGSVATPQLRCRGMCRADEICASASSEAVDRCVPATCENALLYGCGLRHQVRTSQYSCPKGFDPSNNALQVGAPERAQSGGTSNQFSSNRLGSNRLEIRRPCEASSCGIGDGFCVAAGEGTRSSVLVVACDAGPFLLSSFVPASNANGCSIHLPKENVRRGVEGSRIFDAGVHYVDSFARAPARSAEVYDLSLLAVLIGLASGACLLLVVWVLWLTWNRRRRLCRGRPGWKREGGYPPLPKLAVSGVSALNRFPPRALPPRAVTL